MLYAAALGPRACMHTAHGFGADASSARSAMAALCISGLARGADGLSPNVLVASGTVHSGMAYSLLAVGVIFLLVSRAVMQGASTPLHAETGAQYLLMQILAQDSHPVFLR